MEGTENILNYSREVAPAKSVEINILIISRIQIDMENAIKDLKLPGPFWTKMTVQS